MPRGYWISVYREIIDADKLAAYAAIAGPALEANGGRYLVRGGRVEAKEAGLEERTVVVEFESFEVALAAYKTDAYQAALKKLDGGVVRDLRIVEGVI